MRKWLIFIVISLCAILPFGVKANTINEIDMTIYIDKYGDALVTEIWSANLTQGTEGYKPYYNLGNANISDFKVKLGDKEYTYLNTWNVNGSFQSKAFKNGINYTSDGLELCWGISQYGYNEYTLTYKINGFVSQTTDAQMIYWTLIPHDLSSKPKNVHIKIYGDENFSSELPVWGYGNYGGTAYVYDGYIEMNSEGVLDSDEYMTILVKFPQNTFNTDNILTDNFDYYYDRAEKGAKHYVDIGSRLNWIIDFAPIIVFIIVSLTCSIGVGSSKNKFGNYKLNFKPAGKKIPKDIPNIREIPFGNNIFYTYWVAKAYGLMENQSDFLGAIILKWVMEDKIVLRKQETGTFTNKEETVIDMTKDSQFENELELELFGMMKMASKNGILETNEFKKWCSSNYEKIFEWFDSVVDYQTLELIKENKIIVEDNKVKLFSSNKYMVQPIMLEEAKKLQGLKNFLLEFSRIDDREAIEVHLWQYYLIYAQILGIANKVAKQFKKLYPELIENYGYDYDDIIFVNYISYSGLRSATTSETRARSYSSGGGGFSSGGGGGGSFGGGGGGGGFR